MKPVYQTVFGTPLGNCLQACIASLFEVPLESVPNFMDAPDDEWWDKYHDWIFNHFGVQPLGVNVNQKDGREWFPMGYHLVIGGTTRGNCRHAVVALNGTVVHDPYPGGNGIESPEFYHVFVACNLP